MTLRYNFPPLPWTVAHRILDKRNDGAKLAYSACRNKKHGLVPRPKNAGNNFETYVTTHSFIKVGDRIYALALGKGVDAIIGAGASAKVKYAEDENQIIWAIKIQKRLKWSRVEAFISEDLALSVAHAQNPESGKVYTVMHYLGEPLNERLKRQPLTEQEQIDFSMQLCWRTFKLHHGQLSRLGIAYAHSDLKQRNLTVDERGNLHLVDFGYTKANPRGIKFRKAGTAKFLPPPDADGFIFQSREECDLLALLRILHMPEQCHCYSGYTMNSEDEDDKNLLSRELIEKYQLREYLDTGSESEEKPYDFEKRKPSAIELCAMFAAINITLPLPFQHIFRNKQNALVIAGLHMAGKSREEILATLTSPQQCKLVAALIELNIFAKLNVYLHDEKLMQIIANIDNHEVVCALILTNEMGLMAAFDLPNMPLSAARAILMLSRAGLGRLIQPLSVLPALAPMLCFLEENGLEKYYENAFSEPNLRLALHNLAQARDKKIIIALAARGISKLPAEELVRIIEDKSISVPIYILAKYRLMHYVKYVLQSSEMAKAIIDCKHPRAFTLSQNVAQLADYFTDEEFKQAVNSAQNNETAVAVIELKRKDMGLFYVNVLGSPAIAAAIGILAEHGLEDFYVNVLRSEELARAIGCFAAQRNLRASKFRRVLVCLTGSISTLSAVSYLISQNVKSHTALTPLVENYKLTGVITYLLNNNYSDLILPVIHTLQTFPAYKFLLQLAATSFQLNAVARIAMWEMDDVAQEIEEGNSLLMHMMGHASQKDQAGLFLKFYKILEDIEDETDKYPTSADDTTLSDTLRNITQFALNFFTPPGKAFNPNNFPLFKRLVLAEVEKFKLSLGAQEPAASSIKELIVTVSAMEAYFPAIEADILLVDLNTNLFGRTSHSSLSSPEIQHKPYAQSTSSTLQ